MKKQLYKEHLLIVLKDMEYYNRYAPFPPYDTEYVEVLRSKINKMNNEKEKFDYDSIPVASCKYCNKLRIKQDEFENDVCLNCGSVNELRIYKTIHDYLKHKEKDFEDEGN